MEVLEESFTLGKRQLNILAETLTGAPSINMERAQPLSRQDIVTQLGAFIYSDTFQSSGETNIKRPVVIGEVLGKQARKIGYIDGVAENDLVPLVDATTEACSNRRAPLVFRMVYGATEQASLRALSYPLPALQVIDRVRERADIPMSVQIIFANNIAGRLNGLEEGLIAEEAANIQEGVMKIAQQMGLAERVGFYDDSLIGFEEIEGTADTFEKTASDEFLTLFKGKGPSHKQDTAHMYAAAHHVLHDSSDSRFQHLAGSEIPYEAGIIDVGGIQEKYFRAARKLIAMALDTELAAPQLYTRHRIPPYYMARGRDIALRDYLAGSKVDKEMPPAAQADIDYLQRSVNLGRLREEVYV